MTQQADIVLRGGKITTMALGSSAPETVDSIALLGSEVLSVTDAEAHIGNGTHVIDLKGARVVPGLIDSHVHFIRAGRTWNDEVRFENLYSLKDGLHALAERAASQKAGTWIRVIGGWDEHQFAEQRGPTREELDQVIPNHPVYVQMQYDYAVLNSLGLKTLGITTETIDKTPLPEGFEKDSEGSITGKASGMPLMTWFYRQLPAPSYDEQVESTVALSHEFARLGMTGAIDGGGVNTGPEAYAAVYEAWRQGRLKTRVRLFKHATRAGTEQADYAGYLRFGSPRFGDDILRFSGIGEVIMYRTHDRIAAPADYGEEAMAETREVLLECARKGWTVQIHVHQREFFLKLLDLWEEIDSIHPINQLRWSFVHAESTYLEDAERLKKLGAGLLFQSLLRYNGEYAVEAWGADRVAHSPELADLWDAGVPIGLGSDAMRVASYNPFASLEWFLTGKTVRGNKTLDEKYLLDRHRALRGYTQVGAWFTHEENVRGQLVPGQYADLAVLSEDYFTIPTDRIHTLTSDLTIVGGEIVWDSGALHH